MPILSEEETALVVTYALWKRWGYVPTPIQVAEYTFASTEKKKELWNQERQDGACATSRRNS